MQDYETHFPSSEINLQIAAGSNETAQQINKALALDTQGEVDRALFTLNSLLETEPRNPSLYFLMARLFLSKQDGKMAREAIDKALLLNKSEPNYLKLQGDIYTFNNLPDKAVSAYKRSLKQESRFVPALNNLGNQHRIQGKLDDAVKSLKRALANDEFYVPARYNLALAYLDQRNWIEADKELSACVEQAPDMPEPWFALISLKKQQNEDQSIIVSLLDSAIEANPSNINLRLSLVDSLERLADTENASAQYKIINELAPDLGEQYELMSYSNMNSLEQPMAQYFAGQATKLDFSHYRNYLFMSSYLAVVDAETCFQIHRNWDHDVCDELRKSQYLHTPDGITNRKLRIGYVSPDFYAHSVSFFIRSILEHHNRDQFEIYCYAHMRAAADKITAELKGLADHWREVQTLSDFEMARLINRDKIDLLIDLSGHTRGSRVSAFAYKPAPIQVTYLGYPGSTGLTEMDYWLTDRYVHPENTPEPSSEKIYRMNRCWIVYKNEDIQEIEQKPEELPFTFGVINHIGKHSAAFVNAWIQILEQNPDAHLIVKSIEFMSSDLRVKVLNRLESLGLDRRRVQLMGQTRTHADHQKVYNQIDVCLDPFPYNGGTSSADALAMGTPVVTLAGDLLKSRMGVSILSSVGYPEWITTSVEDYVRLAGEFVKRGVTLEEKLAIRQHFLDSDLSNGPGLVKELESAYTDMWLSYNNPENHEVH